MPEIGFSELVRRLDAIIALLVVTLPQSDQPRSLREEITMLDAAGLGPTEISRIVDRPAKTVTSELARIRRKKKGSKRAPEKE